MGAEPDQKPATAQPMPVDRESVTQHEAQDLCGGLSWTATAATWTLRDQAREARCTRSFVSYVRQGEQGVRAADRPVTFIFNGGPGASAVWLHLGVFGPRRLDFADGLAPLTPPYRLVDNPDTLLAVSDLVFIDPDDTGYSRVAPGVERGEFLGLDEDVTWVGEFIRTWLTRQGRWASPTYVAGESYGTTRAAALADHLGAEHGIGVSGVLLISSVLLFQTLYADVGNDLPYVLALPTLAATAWHHGKSDPALADLEAVVAAAEQLATGDYATYLLRENYVGDAERDALANRLARLLGVSTELLLRNRLRLPKDRFRKELRREDGLVVAHFDGRLVGHDADAGASSALEDPSFWQVRFPFTGAYLDYLREVLEVDVDESYVVVNTELGADWKWGEAAKVPKYVDVASRLREAMLRNPGLRVFLGNGYYDFATPFFAAEWTLDHLGLPADCAAGITMRRYRAGHMMYTDSACLSELAQDVSAFVQAG